MMTGAWASGLCKKKFLHNDTCSLGGYRCEHVLRIELVLNEMTAQLVFKELQNVRRAEAQK